MLAIGLSITQVVMTTIAATAIGAWVLGSRFTFHHEAFRWAVRTAVGLLIVSHTILVLALSSFVRGTHRGALCALLGLIALMWLGSKPWRVGTRVNMREDSG